MSDERRIYYGCRCLQCYAEWFDQYSYHRTTDFVINGGYEQVFGPPQGAEVLASIIF